MNPEKEIRRSVDTGKVVFGAKNTEKSLLSGKGKMAITSKNPRKIEMERIQEYCKISGTPVYSFSGSPRELGSVCGKPFGVTAMLVLDAGKSKVLGLVKGK